MRDRIERPAARAVVSWLSAEQGGRRSGPPTAPVYMATAVFPLGGERATHPGWPIGADPFLSVFLEEIPGFPPDVRVYKVYFPVHEPAVPFLHPGAEMQVTEGPKVVAHAVIREVFGEDGDVGRPSC